MLRLDYLEGRGRRAGRALERYVRLVALGSVLAVIALTATLPSWALAGPQSEHSLRDAGAHCH